MLDRAFDQSGRRRQCVRSIGAHLTLGDAAKRTACRGEWVSCDVGPWSMIWPETGRIGVAASGGHRLPGRAVSLLRDFAQPLTASVPIRLVPAPEHDVGHVPSLLCATHPGSFRIDLLDGARPRRPVPGREDDIVADLEGDLRPVEVGHNRASGARSSVEERTADGSRRGPAQHVWS